MNDYQFWDELGKIFNAVVAYQEKAVEFNKRFINPWIPLGNVFDRQERNNEAIHAFHKAIELDPANGQNWYELANVHFRMKSYDEAIEAYRKAIEINPEHGSAYSNLALALVGLGRLAEAVPLYQRSIELLSDDKERAVAWNRLGNVHRKLNEYTLAVQAFQKADELDGENAGFRDDLDEAPRVSESGRPGGANEMAGAAAVETLDPLQLIVAEGRAQEFAAAATQQAEMSAADEADPVAAGEGAAPGLETMVDEPANASTEVAASDDVSDVATETEGLPQGEALPVAAANITEPMSAEPPFEPIAAEPTAGAAEMESPVEPSENQVEPPVAIPAAAEGELVSLPVESASEPELLALASDLPASESPAALPHQAFPGHVAYDEYLKDNDPPLNIMINEAGEQVVPDQEPGQEPPAAKIDESGELQIEMDAKNAHVWNELGNIYFNNGEFDDAVIAYSKSIELDRWFAWPYSNLALTYVQKNRFAEAILLYQRSIELFKDEKDQAITWNRLGNVYRRLNDYDNAIAAYQHADDLDPDNATLSLQSRFSLLGSYAVEPKPAYVS